MSANDGDAGTSNGLGQKLKRLGPGLVTGAADDDPSGIATYSQTGAQFGTGLRHKEAHDGAPCPARAAGTMSASAN